MSAKHTIFPPGRRGDTNQNQSAGDDDGLYTGHPSSFEGEPSGGSSFGRGTAKGHAAYAAQDHEMPPSTPPGGGSVGGLFAGRQVPPSGAAGHPGENSGDLLSVVPDDRLREECQARICPSCPVQKEAEDTRLRALADLDNAKKRLNREREEQVKFAAESILNDIIPSLDNLDLALQHAAKNEGCKDFVIGVQMTRKLLQDTLEKHGLKKAGAIGDEFDPALHEAVGMVNSHDVPDNHVCGLLSSGYTLNGRLLRPAKVMVCKR